MNLKEMKPKLNNIFGIFGDKIKYVRYMTFTNTGKIKFNQYNFL